MQRFLAFAGLIAVLGFAPTVQAGRVLVLVDADRLLELDVRSQYLLPDGRIIDQDRVIRACSDRRSAGWVVYDPFADVCRPETAISVTLRPPQRPEASGILVFDSVSRQECHPAACRVLVGMPPGDALFSDRFEAAP